MRSNKETMNRTSSTTRKLKQPVDEKSKVSTKLPGQTKREKSTTRSNEKNDLNKAIVTKLSNSGTKQPALQKQVSLKSNSQRTTNFSTTKTTKPLAARQTTERLSNIKTSTNLDNNLKKQLSSKLSSTNSTRKNVSENKLSSRVTTTKYFPQKPVFQKIVQNKDETKDQKLERSRSKIKEPNKKPVRSRSRTLSPSEIKILKNPNQIQSNNEIKLDNSPNIEIKPINLDNEGDSKSPKSDYSYEDDFESYESDFESYLSSKSSSSSSSSSAYSVSSPSTSSSRSSSSDSDSDLQTKSSTNEKPIIKMRIKSKQVTKQGVNTEEEKKLDSGNYDLHEPRTIKRLYDIKEAVERENSFITTKNQDISLSDEGFDEKTPSFVLKSFNNNFINFEDAKKSAINLKYSQKIKKRGEEILKMITLDTISETLLEMFPIPYEIYMSNYGRKGTNQAYCQTNDDALSEEIQTDEIESKCKWTQLPIDSGSQFSDVNDLLYHYRYLQGSGDDPPKKCKYSVENIEKIEYNVEKLNLFLRTKLQLVMKLLSNKKSKEVCIKTDLPFSSTYRKLNTDLTFLKGRSVTILEYFDSQFTFILTVHEPNLREGIAEEEELFRRSMICIWSLYDLTIPNKTLISMEEVTSVCLEENRVNLVFAGLKNGAVCVWNLNESTEHHKVVVDDLGNVWNLRLPAFVTAPEDYTEEQISMIKVVKSLNCDDNGPLQICTLSQTGRLLVWSVVNTIQLRPGQTHDPGLAHWGTVRIVPGTSMTLQNIFQNNYDLECFDLQLDSKDPNHLYISANSTYVIHCLTTGTKTTPKFYESNIGNMSHTTCIEPCPFRESYFLVGCDDGSIRLHARNTAKALITLFSVENKTNENNSIKIIRWSTTKPHNIFAVDNKNILHVWNLELSDIYPIYSIPFKETITALKYVTVKNAKKSFMIIAFSNGKVKIFDLNDEFSNKFTNDVEQDLRKFLYYVNIL